MIDKYFKFEYKNVDIGDWRWFKIYDDGISTMVGDALPDRYLGCDAGVWYEDRNSVVIGERDL